MAEVLGAQLVIEALKREGVNTVYVLPGDPVGSIVNNAAAMGMRVISVRNEQVGALAAQAHSYFTRTCGVAIAASGPAHTNTITGMEMRGRIVGRCWSSLAPPRTAGGTWEIFRRRHRSSPQLPSASGLTWSRVRSASR